MSYLSDIRVELSQLFYVTTDSILYPLSLPPEAYHSLGKQAPKAQLLECGAAGMERVALLRSLSCSTTVACRSLLLRAKPRSRLFFSSSSSLSLRASQRNVSRALSSSSSLRRWTLGAVRSAGVRRRFYLTPRAISTSPSPISHGKVEMP